MGKLKELLKKNRFIYKLGRSCRLMLDKLNKRLTNWHNQQRFINKSEGTLLVHLGNFKLKLNESISHEKRLLFDKAEEVNWLHSIKMLLNEKSLVVFINPSSFLIPLFLAKNVGCKIQVLDNGNLSLRKTCEEKDLKGIDFINQLSKDVEIDLVFINSSDDLHEWKFKQAILIDGQLNPEIKSDLSIYKNLDGRYLKKDHSGADDVRIDFFLFKKETLYPFTIHSANSSKKISGATYLRSPEIYPFDLCYASVLDVVDEFVFGIDKVLVVDNEEEHQKRDHFIERFMDGLSEEHRKKVRIEEFDFCERFNRNLNIPAKWLVDVSNSLLDRCNFDNICFIQADEMYHEKNHEQILRFSRQNKIRALNHEFLHFMFDLGHIRNPQTVAYTHAYRVFKRDDFSCTGDGYSFVPIRSPHYIPRIELSEFPIYHLGYVIDFRKKMEIHMSQGGLFNFKDQKVDIDKWIYKADLVSYKGSYPNSLFQKNKISSDKIKPFIECLAIE